MDTIEPKDKASISLQFSLEVKLERFNRGIDRANFSKFSYLLRQTYINSKKSRKTCHPGHVFLTFEFLTVNVLSLFGHGK